MNILLFLPALIILVILIWIYYIRKRFLYWKMKNVPYLQPNLIFGNIGRLILQQKSCVEYYQDLYNKSSGMKYVGYFWFQRPVLLIRDPELIRIIMSNNFPNFADRNKAGVRKTDILSYHIVNLNGHQWRNLRSKMTPTFTIGKIKFTYYERLIDCADILVKQIEKLFDNNEKTSVVNFTDLFLRYNVQVICKCFFGINAECLENRENYFHEIGEKIYGTSAWQKIYTIASSLFPKLTSLLRLKKSHKRVEKFLLMQIRNEIEYRKNNGEIMNDFLQFLIQLMENESKGSNIENIDMTEERIAAQLYVFLFAGIGSSTTTMSFCLFELSKNLEIQDKVYEEISKELKNNNGILTYDSILQEMPYFNKVVLETMRLHPPGPFLVRQCTKDFCIPQTDVIIEKETEVFIPVIGLHTDPQYYPNPDKFNPENFSQDNIESRPKFTYLPFGQGPRMCIGHRFGLIQMKLGLIRLLHQYKFSQNKAEFTVKYRLGINVAQSATPIILNVCKR